MEMILINDVELAKNGDTQAFARLIQYTKNTVTSIALAIVKDLDNSEEVAQQVFISTWQNLNQLKSNTSFLPWLRQVTRYTAYNFLRDNKVDKKIVGEKAEALLSQFCDPYYDQHELLERDQQSLILNDFISQLPEDSREIILLYYREEKSSKQVARLLELSESNVRKKLSRVRELLKLKLLKKYGKVILSTAPTLGFTTFIVNALISSSPAVAATVTSSIVSGKSSLLAKFAFILGGAMVGVFASILAIIFSTRRTVKNISDEQARKQLLIYRNQTIIWVSITGILFALSYELTTGWIGPLLTYTLLAVGLVNQMRIMSNFTLQNMECEQSIRRKRFQRFCGFTGLIGGLLTGYSGLIIGLLNHGRM